MNVAHPQMLWCALLMLAGLGVFLAWAWRTRQRLLRQFVQKRHLETLLANVSRQRQKARLIVLFLGIACIALSLARPQWGVAWEETRQRGLDIVVAIDTSRSMLANDIAPNRLARAKLAALDLMRLAESDRLGLVAFAGTAFLQCPLTLDEEAFRQSVDALDTAIIPQGGSALAEAINTAMQAFASEEDNHKVLVLFTDGEDHEQGAVEAAQEAAGKGMRIFTVGVGTPDGELLRITDESGRSTFLKDDDGNAVKSRLNETLLRQIASATEGGFYLPLRGANVVETLYEKGLAPLPKAEISSKFIQRYQDRFQWPLVLGILLLAVEMFISERKRVPSGANAFAMPGANATPAIILVLLVGVTLASGASPGEARRAFQEGRYKEAQDAYQQLAEEKPGDPRLSYNAGASAYRAGAYDAAAEQFTAALRAQDVNLQQQAYYNLGNTLFRAGEQQPELQEKIGAWEQAVKQFESALKLKPEDADAQFNHDVVRKKLEELKQQQQQQNQQNQDQQKQDNQKDNQDQRKDDQSKQDQQNKENQQPKQDPNDTSQKKDSDKNDSQKDETKQNQQTNQKQDKEDDKSEQQSNAKQSGGRNDDKDKQGQKQDQQSKARGNKSEEAQTSQAGGAIGQMSLQQAMQLLDAQKGDVKALIFRPPETNTSPSRIYKNW